MAVLEILTYPDPRLKRRAAPVEVFDAELRGFVADLGQTLDQGPGAVGIAAPQVGRAQRVLIIDIRSLLAGRKRRLKTSNHGRRVLINPEIVAREGEVSGREGCLSVPDFTGNVVRARAVRLKAAGVDGAVSSYEFEGFEARVVQHELDHLDGILFLDRVMSARELFRRQVYK